MTDQLVTNGYEGVLSEPTRRAIFDLRRQVIDLKNNGASSSEPNAHNALGIIATGTFAVGDGQGWTVGGQLTNPIVVHWLAGRRYRVHCAIRAVSAQTNQSYYLSLVMDGQPRVDRYQNTFGALGYNQAVLDHMFDGDDATHTLNIFIQGGFGPGSMAGYPAEWYIEDVGPNPSIAPAPIPADDTPWATPGLQNGWHNIGANWSPAGYRRIGEITYLRGIVARTDPVPAATFTTVWTLPVGFRPQRDCIMTASCSGATGYGDAQTRIHVMSDGQVQVVGANPAAQGQQGYTSFDGMVVPAT